MPRFSASTHSYGSGFDTIATRDTFADFRSWWDRNCLVAAEMPWQPRKQTQDSLPIAA
ncbi:hypothetical protein [Alloyangia pacifica]|uniref:hypothetical protein n=1 Tax=Alloyangia pacifica TaxID=311180 RepID=UPI001CD68448|nr:hypothetical protein [Alloyangia pacifica]MCA0996950.1 hypothetical protein [Alloyangia pacifica]